MCLTRCPRVQLSLHFLSKWWMTKRSRGSPDTMTGLKGDGPWLVSCSPSSTEGSLTTETRTSDFNQTLLQKKQQKEPQRTRRNAGKDSTLVERCHIWQGLQSFGRKAVQSSKLRICLQHLHMTTVAKGDVTHTHTHKHRSHFVRKKPKMVDKKSSPINSHV